MDNVCVVCDQQIDGEPFWDHYLRDNRHPEFGAFHMDCVDNDRKPDNLKVCDVCGLTGKDMTGNYPGLYVQGKVQHQIHIDPDDYRKIRAFNRAEANA